MKNYILAVSLLVFGINSSFVKVSNPKNSNSAKPTMEELDEMYKSAWSSPEYAKANSAVDEHYLTPAEKKIFYYLNLARLNPKLFASTYATGYNGAAGVSNDPGFETNKKSLIKDLNNITILLPVLVPNKLMYETAKCQAAAIGAKGLMTHDRSETACQTNFGGENISFGKLNSLDIVMQFLNDAGVSNMGHRRNCLDKYFTSMGLSIHTHTKWDQCAVLDFKRDQ